MAKYSRPFRLDEDFMEANKREAGEVPSSERRGCAAFIQWCWEAFFTLLVPTEKSRICASGAGCCRKVKSPPYPSSTHGPNKKLGEG